jgi:hypothetical protein
MNQVPEKLYIGQNLKQYVMKEAVIYKILRYRQNRIDVTPMRSDGQITADTKQKSNIPNRVSPYSPYIPDCTKTHIIKTALPISLPGVKKLLHNINTHRSCAPKTIKLFDFPIF